MKSKLLLVILALALTLGIICSCSSGKGSADQNTDSSQNGDQNNNQGGDNSQIADVDNLIFGPNVVPAVICNTPEALSSEISTIQDAIFYCTYYIPNVTSDAAAQAEHEVILGKSNREVSKRAYTLLNRLEKEDEYDVGYLIYSDGSSIAIAYEEDRYHTDMAATLAAEFFYDWCNGKEYVAVAKSTIGSLTFDVIERQEEIDAAESEAQWKIFEQQVNKLGGDGAAVTKAARDYYDRVCTDNVISWFANLYDPAIGGYYFSNGSRNTPGFLPDAESTTQALQEFHSSGMLRKYGNSYIEGLPEWFRSQIVAFLKSLQDPETGYFYHPQWSKEEVNAHLSRRSRDMTKSCSILKSLGSAPTYDTPSGTKGDGIKWDGTRVDEVVAPSSMTTRLSYSNKSLAVSKVVPTASVAVAAHLQNDRTFKAYLDEQASLNAAGKRSFYAIGNEIGSQVSEIKKRDETLKKEGLNFDSNGNEYSLGDILIEWYTEHQDKETGLWDKGVNYDATNALLKIVGTFDEFGYIFPNAEKALQSCLVMAVSDDEALTVCYVYNIWFAIEELITSVNKYSNSAAEKEYANSVRKTLLEMAPEAIKISAEKQLQFKKEDGSFSFSKDGNCITSQGMRVGIPGDGDGDVNATIICLGGTINRCLRTMGLEQYAPGFFTEADRLRYIAILEELGPVIKDDVDVPIDYDDFDDESVGSAPQNITCDNLKGGTFVVADDPMPDVSGDKALKFVNKAGDYEAVQVSSQSGALTATCFVFETDFFVEYSSEKVTFTQFYLQDAVYMINVVEENGKMKLVETSATSWSLSKQQDLGVRLNFGQWHNIKIQYFVGDHDTVRIKVFINEELIAVTDNYFDKTGEKLTGVGTPKDRMDFVNIIGLTSADVSMYLDNIACYKTAEIYKPIPANQKQPPINVDPPERDLVVHDFEDNKLSDEFTVNSNGASVSLESVDGDGVLKVGATANGATPSVITLPINLRFGKARCVVLDTYVTVSEDASGTLQRIWFADTLIKQNPLACFDIAVKEIGGEKYVVLVEAPSGNPKAAIDGIAIPLGDEFHLRMEYYEQETMTLIYVNDKLVGLSNATCPNAVKYSAGALYMEGVAGGTGSIVFDDFIFEKDVISFESSSSGDTDRVVNGFDSIPEGGELSGGANITDGQANLGSLGASIKLPVLERNEVNTSLEFTTDFIYKSGKGSYVFTLLSEEGTEIIAVEMVVDGNIAEFYEYYEGGRGVQIGYASLRDYSFKLRMNYYYNEAICNIFIGSAPIAKTSLTWLHNREGLVPAYVELSQLSANVSAAIDNTVAEKTLALYTAITPENALTKPSAKPVEDFEEISFGNFPPNITSSLSSSASVAVKAMINGSNVSKYLAFTTKPGSNDSVTFNMADSSKLQGAKVAVFEADMMFNANKGEKKNGVELYLRNGSDKNANKFSIYSQPDDKITVSDYLNSKGKASYTGAWPVGNGEFFKLRVEYIPTDTDVKINFFINGEYVGKSLIFVPEDKPYSAEEITRVVFYVNNALDATIYFDNVSFYQTNDATYVPSRDPGENFMQGGLTYEGMTSVWADIDKGGTSKELPLDDKLIVRNTSVMATAIDAKNPYLAFFSDNLGTGALFGKQNNDMMGEMYLKNLGGVGNCYVFDTQMQLGNVEGLQGNGSKWLLRLAFADGYRNVRSVAMPNLYASFDILANDDGTFAIGNKTVSGDAWINLTIEYYPDSYALVAYVDGEVVAVQRVEGKLENFKRVAFFLREEASLAEIKLDNTSAYVTEKAFKQTLPNDTKDSLAEVLPVKGGANGIVVVIHDDGDLESCSTLDKLYFKYGLRGDVAMIVNRVYDEATGTVKTDIASKWQQLLNTGRWSVVNHSYTHTAYGSEVNGEFVVDEEKLIKEIITSGELLRAIFPSEEVLAYAYPGFGALNTAHGDRLYDLARTLIRQYYVVAREMAGGSVELGDEIWEFISSESMATNRVNDTIKRIEEAADGGMAVLFTHKVGAGGDITAEAMEQILAALAQKVEAGEVWNAHLQDAARYRREAECATVSSTLQGENILITLTDTLENSIFNIALTVKVKVDSTWEAVKITQGSAVSYAVAKDGYILADIIPDGGVATVTKIALSEVPTPTPETPIPSPDLGFDNNEEEGGDTPGGTTPPTEDGEEQEPEVPTPTPPKDETFDDIGEIPKNPDDAGTDDAFGWT